MNVENYYKGLVKYSYSESKKYFVHDLDDDYQLFIIWQNGRSCEDEIIQAIKLNFNIVSSISMQWSERNAVQNFNRFYKAIDNPQISDKAETMGKGEFLCLVVKDNNPKYHYRKTVSGAIELVNSKTVKIKREVREICGGYYVHSTASPEEFYEQAILLFGEDLLQEVLDCQHEALVLDQDLKGAEGWSGFPELLTTLKYSSKYLVLRNFEFLPFNFFNNDKDVDALCENVMDFISASNAKVLSLTDGGAKLMVKIEDKQVPFDIRFIGDGYYHSSWERDMLEQRVKTIDNVYKPRLDDYFFSLLYHAVLQKPDIKPIYIQRFASISNELQFDFFDINKINDKRYIASIIEGFFVFKNYLYTNPKDTKVYVNYSTLKYLPKELGGKKSKKIKSLIRLAVPQVFIDVIPNNIKIKAHSLIG